MTVRPPGSRVWLTYDGQRMQPGDYLRTRTGRLYLIDAVRIQERGKWAGRQHLTCVVMPADHSPESDAAVRLIVWYAR